MKHPITRRRFLQSSAGAAALTVAAASVPSLAATTVPATQPVKKLNVGMIGIGSQGSWHLGILQKIDCANIVAFCDVDQAMLDKASAKVPSAAKFGDFRELLKMPELDAVLIAIPDHSHAAVTAAALKAGKHVYCEKPLTRTIRELRRIVDLAKQTGRVTQMGIQIHSEDNYRRVVEIIQSGAIGPVSRVEIWNNRHNPPADTTVVDPVPSTFNYDTWLGPLAPRPLLKGYHPYSWRRFWPFGSALLGDIGCHLMDVAFWALDLKYPTRIQCTSSPMSGEITPEWTLAHFEFPARGDKPPVKLSWYDPPNKPEAHSSWDLSDKLKGEGIMFIGEEGMLCTDYYEHRLLPAEKFKNYKAPPPRLPHSPGHQKEWILACLKNDPSAVSAPFAYGALLTETVMLGTIALRTGQTLEWDPQAMHFINGPDAAEKLLGYDYRAGWSL